MVMAVGLAYEYPPFFLSFYPFYPKSILKQKHFFSGSWASAKVELQDMAAGC
jgi:hypothetical protein